MRKWLKGNLPGKPLMPTYHPTHLPRHPSLAEKRQVWEDLQAVLESLLFHLDLLTGHELALAPERELSHCQAEVRLAALRQATPLGRFSARASIRAAVWDKPRSSLRRPKERWFMESLLFHLDLLTGHEPRDWSAGLRPGSIRRPDTNAPGRRPALRAVHGKAGAAPQY